MRELVERYEENSVGGGDSRLMIETLFPKVDQSPLTYSGGSAIFFAVCTIDVIDRYTQSSTLVEFVQMKTTWENVDVLWPGLE